MKRKKKMQDKKKEERKITEIKEGNEKRTMNIKKKEREAGRDTEREDEENAE